MERNILESGKVARSAEEFTLDNLAEYMKLGNGTRYPPYKLANAFHCSTDEMREVLRQLVVADRVEEVVIGRQRIFFIRTDAERATIAAMNAPPKAMRPYQPTGPEWDRVTERLAEFSGN